YSTELTHSIHPVVTTSTPLHYIFSLHYAHPIWLISNLPTRPPRFVWPRVHKLKNYCCRPCTEAYQPPAARLWGQWTGYWKLVVSICTNVNNLANPWRPSKYCNIALSICKLRPSALARWPF